MNITNRAKPLIGLLTVIAAIAVWACLGGGTPPPDAIKDLNVNIAPLSASPDVVSVGTQTPITVSASVGALPFGLVLECPDETACWSFNLVKVQYRTAKPTSGFTTWDAWDWSTDSGATDVTSNSTYYTDDLDSNGGHSGIKHFNFTPLKPGYWHLTVQAIATETLRNVVTHVVADHTNLGNPDTQQTSPNTGLTLTSVQLSIYWEGADLLWDTTHGEYPTIPAGTEITNRTNYMIIGKRVMLQAAMSPADLAISSPCWTIPHTSGLASPGCAVVGFTTNPADWFYPDYNKPMVDPAGSPATGSVDPLMNHTADMLDQPPPGSLNFYWSMPSSNPENDIVKYSVTTVGPVSSRSFTITAQTTFVLEAPTISSPAIPGAGQPSLSDQTYGHRGSPALTCGNYFIADHFVYGLTSIPSQSSPPHASGPGTLFFVQIIKNHSREYTYLDTFGSIIPWSPGDRTSGLDRTYPYPMNNVYLGSYPGPHVLGFADSPDAALNISTFDGAFEGGTTESLTMSDQFDCYLLYEPAGTNTIYVPVRLIQWRWGGTATLGGSGLAFNVANWTLSNGYLSVDYNGAPDGWDTWTQNAYVPP